MKQFGTILNFELRNYFKNKVFVGITIALVVLIAAAMFFPNIMAFFQSDDSAAGQEEQAVMLIASDSQEQAEAMRRPFAKLLRATMSACAGRCR